MSKSYKKRLLILGAIGVIGAIVFDVDFMLVKKLG